MMARKLAKVWMWRASMVGRLVKRSASFNSLTANQSRASDARLPAILMAKDEQDVLDGFLKEASRYFNPIVVLDGSIGAAWESSKRIYDRYDAVSQVLRDKDVSDGPVRDGARQFLLEALRQQIGFGHWVAVLHADEFFNADPRPFVAAVNPRFSPTLRVQVLHHFLHESRRPSWGHVATLPVRERVPHFMWPGVSEERFFFDDGAVAYDVELHSRVVPSDLPPGIYLPGLTVSQFNYRSPEQAIGRALDRTQSSWQTSHYDFIDDSDSVFVESLNHDGRPYANGGARRHHAGIASASVRAFDDLPGGILDSRVADSRVERISTDRRLLENPGIWRALIWAYHGRSSRSGFQTDANAQARLATALPLAKRSIPLAVRESCLDLYRRCEVPHAAKDC